MRALLLALLLVITPSNGSINAQQNRAPSESPYSLSQIDLNASALPRRYRGVDPQVIINALEKRASERRKDEFETTAAYNARLLAAERQKLIGEYSPADLIPVVASTQSSFERIESQYNADTEELSVKITARSPVIGVTMALDQREIALKYDFQPTRTYTGVNGYGARVTVEKHVTSIYSVLFKNFNSYASELQDRYSSSGTIITRLKLVPSAARAAKENLRALLFVRLRNPAVEKGYISKKPTVQDPHETFAVYYYLVADVEQIWLYNYETGQVYKALIPRQSP